MPPMIALLQPPLVDPRVVALAVALVEECEKQANRPIISCAIHSLLSRISPILNHFCKWLFRAANYVMQPCDGFVADLSEVYSETLAHGGAAMSNSGVHESQVLPYR